MAFDLDQAIRAWRASMRRYTALEPGAIEELESNLHDRYEDYLIQGLAPPDAFAQAKARVSPDPEPVAREYAKAAGSATGWRRYWDSLWFLLPSYLKVAVRNLRRKQLYNAANFCCLSVGILCLTLAVLYLDYETSYDDFVPEAERTYRLGRQFRSQDYSVMSFDGYFGATAKQQMTQLRAIEAIRGVDRACQFYTFGQPNLISVDDKKLPTEDLLQTNTPRAFCDFFGWSFLVGSAAGFSDKLHTAVLTESQAERFFGPDWREQPLIGRLIGFDSLEYSIQGVIEDVPPNSHYTFSIALHQPKIDYWGSRFYVRLDPGADPAAVTRRMDQNMGSINARLAESDLFGGMIMQHIRSIHLDSDMLYELKPPGDRRYLYIIGILSAIILLLTISNYTNLSIAMNAGRSREIGMRKLFGASEGQVGRQFVIESLVLSVLTIPVVLVGLWLLIPYFNSFMGTGLAENPGSEPFFWLLLTGVTVGVGLLASAYPALYLARHRLVKLFRGNLVRNATQGLSARKVIIGLQFMLLIGLCSLTLFVNRQLRYIQEKDLGFDADQVLYVNLSEDSATYEIFKNKLLALPAVTGVGSGSPLGRNPFNQTTYQLEGTSEVFDDAYDISLELDAVRLLGIETSVPEYIAEPNNAPAEFVLINETLVEQLMTRFGLTREELIGRTITEEPEFTDAETGRVGFPFTIAGTFRDINMFSLREKITPMFLTVYQDPGYVNWVSIGFTGTGPQEMLRQAEGTFNELGLDKAFSHSFLTQNIEELYERERRIAQLSIYFSVVAFAVAVIGLIALTLFLTTLKRKEIGVRKILGASHLDILGRFNREYLWLVMIALLVAAPLTYLGVAEWLAGFAYRIDINPIIFVFAGGITLCITSTAVSLMTWRVARSRPARTLQENQ